LVSEALTFCGIFIGVLFLMMSKYARKVLKDKVSIKWRHVYTFRAVVMMFIALVISLILLANVDLPADGYGALKTVSLGVVIGMGGSALVNEFFELGSAGK
jgi:uncharacterized membrane-anchored protein